MEQETFTIKTDLFEGPLDLLLQLVEKRKVFISDVSLADVTDDYITHVKKIEHFPISQTAHFILVASTLLLLKSKALLPTITLTEEEEESIEDLEKRLKIYKYFQELSKKIGAQFNESPLFPKLPVRTSEPVFSPQKNFYPEQARTLVLGVIERLPKKKKINEVTVKKVISLEQSIETLGKRVQEGLRVSFNEFSKLGKTEKINVIVSFLAMLELVKQETIHVRQESHFEDIHMESKDVGLPQY